MDHHTEPPDPQAIAEWLIAEARHKAQRAANTVVDAWFHDTHRRDQTANWLLAEARHETETLRHQLRAASISVGLLKVRLRDSRNDLAKLRARLSQADRTRLLTHRGPWPPEAVLAGMEALLATDGKHTALRVLAILDAAARAMHRDHVHIAIHTNGSPAAVADHIARQEKARAHTFGAHR